MTSLQYQLFRKNNAKAISQNDRVNFLVSMLSSYDYLDQ